MNDILNFESVIPSFPFILEGIGITLRIVALSLIGGLVLGTLLALLKISRSKVLVLLADFYTSIFRGTPLVLQLIIIYYGIPQLFDIEISGYWAAVIAFSLNSTAYVSEIIRAGINAVDKGQVEAASALGVPYGKRMKDIILPQAYRNILPALMNEIITLTKESAIVTVIGLQDVMRRAYIVGGDTYRYLEPLLFAGLIYYIMTLILAYVGKLLERKLNNDQSK
ncbi:MAG: amino acid ABC transporter permease [Bacillaceae bacterium]